MTYSTAVLLASAGALLIDLVVLRTRLVCRPVFWVTYPIILFFQLLANGILAGRGIVRYDAETILGTRVANAPVEDLGFGFALILVTLSVWVWLGRRGVQHTPLAGERSSPLSRSDGSPPRPDPPAPRTPRRPARLRSARSAPDR
ncbi:MAG TPA: lycopene cyclase domain-containing protein [Micromonosporaceae bacterium]